jgi:radical SAM protein with 4Fe4S-binding SPASM domain
LEYRLNRGQIKDFFLDNNIPLIEREADEDMLLCSAGLNNISITPYLDVYPCIGIKYKTGNLWENRLKDLWLSQKLNFIREMKASDLNTCQKCDLVRFCNRCTGIAFAEDRDMLGPSNFDCLVASARKEIVTKKGEGRNG